MSLAHNKDRRIIRIAYVLATDVRAGVEEHVLSLVANLDRERFQPSVVAPPELIEAFGSDLSDLEVTVLPLRIGGITDIKNRGRFWRFLRDNSIDIVNTHMFQTSLKFTPVAFLARVPVTIETAHGLEHWRLDSWIKRKSFLVDRYLSARQSAIVAVSHACKKDLCTVKKIDAEKIIVVQNGRCLDTFDLRQSNDKRLQYRKKYGISDNEFIFGVMARLEPQKGHEYLLEAVGHLAKTRSGFRVLLVGDGRRLKDLQLMAARLGIEKYLIFAGFQSDVVGHYAAMDVKVLPSLYEGLPLCVIEAMAMEKPVIATDVEGTREIVQHMVNGLLVPARNAVSLSEAIEYAMDHREEMLAMGRAGRRCVIENFSLDKQIRETEDLYENLVESATIRRK